MKCAIFCVKIITDVLESLFLNQSVLFFLQSSEYDYSSYVAMFIQVFIKLLADNEVSVQEQAWSALSVLIKRLDAAEQLQHVGSLRQAMRYASDEIKRCGGLLPGFCHPKKVCNETCNVHYNDHQILCLTIRVWLLCFLSCVKGF